MILHQANLVHCAARPAWLERAYGYVGAHKNTMRFENERDRALQRTAMPLVAVAWILVYHWIIGDKLATSEWAWVCAAVLYAVASFTFWSFLERHPEGGVDAQYAFLAFDPLIVGWALSAAPRAMGWWLLLMLVMIVRVGFRYGLNAMKVELGFAWLGALLPLFLSSYWQTKYEISGTLLLMLVFAWWLFAPLSRTLERAKILDIERTRQESLKAKSEFLSRVSHELRSPLQSVVSALDLMGDRFDMNAAQAELLSRIRRGTNSLNAQLRDLQTIARGDVGKMEIDPMPFEAGELVASVVRELRREADGKGLTLVVTTPAEPIFVVADSARIDQVLTNLLTNATRHTTGDCVRLDLLPYDRDQRCLRFEVADSGPGIDKDLIPSLFEPYSRFGEMTRSGEGAGLGLAIVRSVLQFLGGSVTVASEPGHGTTFSVTIPAELLDDEAAFEPGPGVRRVLVVDDRAEVLEGIVSVVQQLGFECDTALTVATAANLLGARPYDPVFLDLDMPVKSGYDLASEVRRSDGPNKTSRIVSISAAEVPEDRRGWPFDGHLTKPITMHAIQRVIAPSTPAGPAPR